MMKKTGQYKIRAKHSLPLIVICLLLLTTIKAEEWKHRTGRFTTTFNERNTISSPAAVAKRMREKLDKRYKGKPYKIENETFQVYVPEAYTPQDPYGLMVWVSPSEKGGPPKDWRPLMDKHKLIWVGADKSGNKHSSRTRRIPLALDAAHNMQQLYNIDPNRVYVAGSSGGGRVASMMAFHYSDVYDGAIFVIGANYWEQMKVPSQKGYVWRPAFRKPRLRYLTRARKFGRYVFLTGDNDGNREQMHTYYEQAYKKILKNVLYIQVPGMGHKKPTAEWFEKAIVFLDTPPITPQKTGQPETSPKIENQKSSIEN